MSLHHTDLETRQLLINEQGDPFEVQGIWDHPAVVVKNLRTGRVITLGVGGLTWKGFRKLVPEDQG